MNEEKIEGNKRLPNVLKVTEVVIFPSWGNVYYGFGYCGLGTYVYSSAFRPQLLIFIPDNE